MAGMKIKQSMTKMECAIITKSGVDGWIGCQATPISRSRKKWRLPQNSGALAWQNDLPGRFVSNRLAIAASRVIAAKNGDQPWTHRQLFVIRFIDQAFCSTNKTGMGGWPIAIASFNMRSDAGVQKSIRT